MESKILTSTMKPEHSLRNAYSNTFSTKLSLPKFIAVAKLLTNDQRRMVKSIGFDHLLDIRCDSVPRGICLWVAKQFDVKSRSIQLSNGSKFLVTPHCIRAVLGIPIGETAIVKKCDSKLKKLIAAETKCRGNTPNINELKALITPDLVGDKFKRIFTLFAIGCFLCPTSYDCISTDYYSAVESPEDISSFDWCSVVLDKLTNAIDSYQRSVAKTSSITLGGCILALVIIYFEQLDIPNHTNHELKNIKQPISLTSATTSEAARGSTTLPIKCIPGSCSFNPDIATLSHDIAIEIASTIEPILARYCDKLHAAWHCPPEATSEDSLVAEKKVLFDPGKLVCQPDLIPPVYMTERITQHLVSSKLLMDKDSVGSKGEEVGPANTTIEPSDDNAAQGQSTVIKEDSVPPEVQRNIQKENLTWKLDKTVEDRSVSKGDATSSFLHVPSFSQDSSNTCSYDGPCPHPLQQPQWADSSNLDQEISKFKPCIKKDGKGMDRVFVSGHCSDTNLLEIPSGAADNNGDSSTATDHHQPAQMRTPEKVIGMEEFDFFGHGMDSEFEVIPQTQQGFPSNADTMLSTLSTRKRPRSLNESALQFYSLRRLDEGSSKGKAANDNNLEATSNAHNTTMDMENTMLSNSIRDLEDAELIDHISRSRPCKSLTYHINFTSTLVEKEVFNDIVERIPYIGSSPRVVKIKKNWVDHKTFGLSMRVYGKVSRYVIDVLGKAVMIEEFKKNKTNLLPRSYWYRHIVRFEKAKLLQKPDADA